MVGHKNKPILSNSGKINHHAMKLKRRDNTTKDLKKLKSDTARYERRWSSRAVSDMESDDTPYNRQDLKQNLKKDLDYLSEE
jgi:hypothetical protein